MEDKQDAPMDPADEGSSIPLDGEQKEAASVPAEKQGQPISDLVNQTFAA